MINAAIMVLLETFCRSVTSHKEGTEIIGTLPNGLTFVVTFLADCYDVTLYENGRGNSTILYCPIEVLAFIKGRAR